MTIQDLGSIGELLAAIATIATLGYLALQLRQNTATVRGASAASQSVITNSVNTLLAQDAEVNRILWTGLADHSQLDEIEIRRFDSIVQMVLEGLQQNWRFNHEGLITDAEWQAARVGVVWLASEPGFRRYWERYGNMQHPGFAEVVEELLAEGSSESNRLSGAAQQSAAADSA